MNGAACVEPKGAGNSDVAEVFGRLGARCAESTECVSGSLGSWYACGESRRLNLMPKPPSPKTPTPTH